MNQDSRDHLRDIGDWFDPDEPLDGPITQIALTRELVLRLQAHPELPADAVAEEFGLHYAGTLQSLGRVGQDEILYRVMAETGVDLVHWLSEQKGN